MRSLVSSRLRAFSEAVIDVMRSMQGTPFAPAKDGVLWVNGWALDLLYDLERSVFGRSGLHPLMRIIRFQAGDPIEYFGLRSIADVRKKFSSLTSFGNRPTYGTISAYITDRMSGLGFLQIVPRSPRGQDIKVVYLHGGGYVMGSAEESEPEGAWFAAHMGFECVIPDYPLAPEARKPVPYESLRTWLDSCVTGRFFIVAESAGGSLALQLLEDPEARRRCLGVCLFYPWLDLSLSSDSMKRLGKDYFLTRELLYMFRSAYLGADQTGPREPTALEGLGYVPPMMTIVGEYDPLLDESVENHVKWRERGGVSVVRIIPGMMHGFLSVRGMLRARREALTLATKFFLEVKTTDF